MNAPYRIAQPPEPERSEEADQYELALAATRHRHLVKMAFAGSVGLFVLGLAAHSSLTRISPHERARALEEARIAHARDVITDARHQLTAENAQFDQALHEVLFESPATSFAACPTELGEPERMIHGRALVPMLIVWPSANAKTYRSPSVSTVENDVGTAEELLAGSNAPAADIYAEAFEHAPVETRLHRDIVFVATAWKPAARSTTITSFEPGSVDGTAYVYDFSEHRVTCMGEIHAVSSKRLEYTFNDSARATWLAQDTRFDATLQEDLDLQLAKAIAAPNALFAIDR